MRDTKRRMEFFSFYDHTGISAHLERMAERGWLLEKIGAFTWRYRRIQPKKLAFSVCYFPQASMYAPQPSDGQNMFYDLCAHTGWTLAASSGQMQVFYNERENPVPIDTDPALEVEAVHQSAKKGYLVSQALLGGAAVLNIIVTLFHLYTDPIRALASPFALFLMVCWPALALVIAFDTGSYFLWRRRALAAARQGEFLATNSHPLLQRGLLAVVLAALVWMLSSLSGGIFLVIAASMACALAALLLVSGAREAMRRKQVSAETNRMVTIAVCVAVSLLIAWGIPSLVLRGTGEASPGVLPLTMDDLMETDYDFATDFTEQLESPLLASFGGRQSPWLHEDMAAGAPSLYYSVTVVKVPLLYDLCKNHLLKQNENRDTDFLPIKYYAPTDSAPWGAQEAYQFMMGEEDEDMRLENTCLLFYPDRIVYFRPSWEPTPEQMAVVAEKLGGQ